MVYIVLGQGFEEMEAITPCDLLRRAGIPTAFAGIGGKDVAGSHGIVIHADVAVEEMDMEGLDMEGLDMIVLPGGRQGVETILGSTVTLEAVSSAWKSGKFVAAICAAPTVLASLGITDGRKVTCYPEEIWTSKMDKAFLQPGAAAVRDGNLITGTSAGCSVPFGLALISALQGEEAARKVEKGIVLR